MIAGSVTADREAVIQIAVQGSAGDEHAIQAVVDTGFTGFLTLPATLIATLGLTFRGRQLVVLGDGSQVFTSVYSGMVVWDGRPTHIEIDEADTDPLIGMSLLYGWELRIQVVDGGSVTVELLP